MGRTPQWLKRELDAVCEETLPIRELAREVSRAIARAVPHDGSCLFGFDPMTGGMSYHTSHGGYADLLRDCSRLADNEALEDDLNRFGELARAPLPVGLLGGDTEKERRSARRHEIMPEAGVGAEMRVALVAGDRLWGALVLVRSHGRRAFTLSDAESLADVSQLLARTIRRLPAIEAGRERSATPPGVILVGTGSVVEAMSAEARYWLDRIAGRTRADDEPLPPVLWQLVSMARRLRVDADAPEPTCRVRAAAGEWVLLHASPLDHERISVVLQAAGPAAMLPALKAWYGITDREHDVLELVIDGRATKEIADALRLSPYTVNDHVKALCRKVGVRGRQELVAALRG
jgi:DNA-binding CsgD family transcriptional regulator